MTGVKQKIIEDIGYTDLVYGRINKKLSTAFSNEQIELLIDKLLKNTDETFYTKIGKNYYVKNMEENISITINASTTRVITVDRIIK